MKKAFSILAILAAILVASPAHSWMFGGAAGNDPANQAITGGTIDGVTIGGTTPGLGYFTSLSATTKFYVNETANAKSTIGITVNQGSNDDEIFSLKSSDVDQPATTVTESDTYGFFKKIAGANGGLQIWGLSDTDAQGIQVIGTIGVADPTDSYPAAQFIGSKLSGTNYGAMGAAETVFDFANYTTSIGHAYGNGEWILTSLQNTPIGSTTASTGAFTTLTGNHKEEIEAATDNIAALQCRGSLINTYGQADDMTLTLPAAAAGLNTCVILGTTVAKYVRVDPAAGDSIYMDGATGGDGKYVGVASAVKGYMICLIAFQTGDGAYDWVASYIGAWVSE